MEKTSDISLDLITVSDPAILRAIKHVRTQNYSKEALEKDASRESPKGLKDSKICLFTIGGKTFSADINDDISKLILGGRQGELYSLSFTKGEEYVDAKGAKRQGINFSSFLTKTQRQEDVNFEQELIIAQSKASLYIKKEEAKIKMMTATVDPEKVNVADLQAAPF